MRRLTGLNRRVAIGAIVLALAAVLLIFGLGYVSIAPGYIDDDENATVSAIEQFHTRQASGQTSDIYRDADENFRNAMSLDNLRKAMLKTRAQYGKPDHVTYKKLSVIMGAPIQIRAVYNTAFQKGPATETFVFSEQGNDIKLAQYQIFPGTVRPTQ